MFPKFCEPLKQIIEEPEEGVIEPRIYKHLVEGTGESRDFQRPPEEESSLTQSTRVKKALYSLWAVTVRTACGQTHIFGVSSIVRRNSIYLSVSFPVILGWVSFFF